MSGAQILKKYNNEWDRLSAGKVYYDIPVTIRRAFFSHACWHVEHEVREFIAFHGYSTAVLTFGEPICRFLHLGKEPEVF